MYLLVCSHLVSKYLRSALDNSEICQLLSQPLLSVLELEGGEIINVS